MKKVLLTVSALGLGLALTATVAAAEMSFSAKGKYNLTGIFVNAGDGLANAGASFIGGPSQDGVDLYDAQSSGEPENAADAFWHHSFYLYPKLVVNDNITMHGQFRFIDRDVWGNGFSTSDDTMRVYQLWMQYTSNLGTFHIGRMQGGTWGTKFMDSIRQRDGIKWVTPFLSDPFSLTLMIEKRTEEDAYNVDNSSTSFDASDQDKDHYYVGLGHKGDMGKTDLAIWSTRTATDSTALDGTVAGDPTLAHELWFNGVYTLGALNIAAEARYMFGEKNATEDYQSLGFMIDANTNLDAITVGGMLIYCQGDDNSSDGDDNGAVLSGGLGNDFNPLAIMTGDYMGLMNADKSGGVLNAYDNLGQYGTGGPLGVMPGALVGAVYANMKASDKLSFNGVLAYARAMETEAGQDEDYGIELDLGFSYKLLDNLTYAGTFGWMNTGDFFQGTGDVDLNNIYLLMHSLTMTF